MLTTTMRAEEAVYPNCALTVLQRGASGRAGHGQMSSKTLAARSRQACTGNRGRRRASTRALLVALITALLVSLASRTTLGAANIFGQTGLVNMPDARVEEDGTLRFGISDFEPYTALWGSVTLFSRLELSGRYTRVENVPGFEDSPEFGDFKDKAFDAKLLLLRESRYVPAIALGTQDFTGTQVFSSDYITFGKRVGDVDLSIGWGRDRIDGVFGGLRYPLPWHKKKLALVAEYDAIDYPNDFRASQSGADKRKGGATYGLEYTFKWGRMQLSYQRGDVGFNAYTSIPLMKREFTEKFDEPPPYTEAPTRPTLEEWQNEPEPARHLARALRKQGFKDIKMRLADGALEASLSHPRISLISRTVGRAARTLFALGPLGIKSIRITYTLSGLPVVTYHFTDAFSLGYYFEGLISQAQLQKTLEITYATPEYERRLAKTAIPDLEVARSTDPAIEPNLGHMLSFSPKRGFGSRFSFDPFNLRFFFNDPSGAFRFDFFSILGYSRPIGRHLFLNGALRLTLAEDVSEVEQPSNSLLPHVRSDVALYKQGDDIRLLSLLLNKYYHVSERSYARLSLGYYEEMFAGTGGQILYLPKRGNWAIDFSLDWLKQRDPEDSLRFRDYSVVTALGAFHYRFPKLGVTTTLRAGRFLAKDDGVRFELKRRFRSGIAVGAWYTVTDIDDTTSPGSPSDPYRDKGIFLSVPLNSVLSRDSRIVTRAALSPWTRDVGQMVESPGDLYGLVEAPLMLDNIEYGPLTDFEK